MIYFAPHYILTGDHDKRCMHCSLQRDFESTNLALIFTSRFDIAYVTPELQQHSSPIIADTILTDPPLEVCC